MDIIRPMPVA
jgi:hypothetical protein